ncbi:MAG: AI-2E family transporter [Actinobacteria bacterium]|nr:AI-2E family transporter [Actinomycetota bacterium]
MEESFWSRELRGDGLFNRRVIRVVVIVLIALLTLQIIFWLRTPIFWLVISAFLAIAASGPVNVLAERMRRGYAIAIVYLAIFVIPLAFAALLLPPLVKSAVSLAKDMPQYVHDVRQWIEQSDLFQRLDDNFDINQKLTDAANDLAGSLDDAAALLGDIGGAAINSIFAGFTILIMSMFMVSRGREWVDAWIASHPKHEAEMLDRTTRRVAGAVSGYIGGAIAQAFVAFLAALIILTIIGAPSPLVLATIVGVFDVIPMVGATIAGLIVGIVTVFGDFPVDTIVWALYVIGYQQFENYVVQPRIQQRAVAVDPFIVLVAVLFGGTLMGITGALLAIPVAATIQIVIQESRTFRKEVKRIRAEEAAVSAADPSEA